MAMESYVLAGGCFWCLDAVYRTLKGVDDVVSGITSNVLRKFMQPPTRTAGS